MRAHTAEKRFHSPLSSSHSTWYSDDRGFSLLRHRHESPQSVDDCDAMTGTLFPCERPRKCSAFVISWNVSSVENKKVLPLPQIVEILLHHWASVCFSADQYFGLVLTSRCVPRASRLPGALRRQRSQEGDHLHEAAAAAAVRDDNHS